MKQCFHDIVLNIALYKLNFMHHLIIGYGYVGYYLAKQLLSTNAEVTAVSRQLNPLFNLPHLNHIACNITSLLPGINQILFFII